MQGYSQMQETQMGRLFQCKYCPATFATVVEFLRHIRTTHHKTPKEMKSDKVLLQNPRPVTNTVHTASVASPSHVLNPAVRNPGNTVTNSSPAITGICVHMCPICSQVFTTQKGLAGHMNSHTKRKPFQSYLNEQHQAVVHTKGQASNHYDGRGQAVLPSMHIVASTSTATSVRPPQIQREQIIGLTKCPNCDVYFASYEEYASHVALNQCISTRSDKEQNELGVKPRQVMFRVSIDSPRISLFNQKQHFSGQIEGNQGSINVSTVVNEANVGIGTEPQDTEIKPDTMSIDKVECPIATECEKTNCDMTSTENVECPICGEHCNNMTDYTHHLKLHLHTNESFSELEASEAKTESASELEASEAKTESMHLLNGEIKVEPEIEEVTSSGRPRRKSAVAARCLSKGENLYDILMYTKGPTINAGWGGDISKVHLHTCRVRYLLNEL